MAAGQRCVLLRFQRLFLQRLKRGRRPQYGRSVYRYEQDDAWFAGGEISAEYLISASWTTGLGLDFVRAQLNKALTATYCAHPASANAKLTWAISALVGQQSRNYFHEQTAVANKESASKAYTSVDVMAAYSLPLADTDLSIELKAHNLFDRYGINHVSYRKNLPVQGRNIEASLRLIF